MSHNPFILQQSPSALQLGPFIFVVAYVFDEVLNGLIGTNFAGALLLLSYALVSLLRSENSEAKVITKFLLGYLVVLLASLIAYASPLGCSVELKGVISLLLFGGVVLLFRKVNFSRIVVNPWISSRILFLILILLVLDALGIGIRELIFGSSKGSGPYSENSHLAVYLLPLMATQVLLYQKNRVIWILLIATAFFAFSSTLLLGVLGVIFLYSIAGENVMRKRFWFTAVMVMAVGLVALTGVLDLSKTLNRIENIFLGSQAEKADHTNLSSLVWLNGWSQAEQTLIETGGLGTGFNQMGCGNFYEFGVFSPLMHQSFGVVLNANDGSFLAAKLISELGVVGMLLVLVLTISSIRAIMQLKNSRLAGNVRSKMITIQAVGALCVLMYLYIRGMGYFQLPILLGISMLYSGRSMFRGSGD